MPKDALKTIQNDLLYSKKNVAIYSTNNDRRAHYTKSTAAAGNTTDKSLTDRIAKFQEQLKNECVYRIPLKLLCDIGLVNQCFKFNTKYILTLETNMRKLFTDALLSVDADNVFTGVSYFMYEQFQLDDSFKTYIEGTV